MAQNAGTELVCVQLVQSIYLPVLLCTVEVMPLMKSDVARLNHVIDRAVYRIFGCSSVEDTSYFRTAVDLLGVEVYIDHRHSQFLHTYSLNYSWSCVLLSIIK